MKQNGQTKSTKKYSAKVDVDGAIQVITSDNKLSVETLYKATDNIRTMTERLQTAYTDAEKSYINDKLTMMNENFTKLKALYEKTYNTVFTYGETKIPENDIEDLEDTDPKYEKGKIKPYDSGSHSYTAKEIKEIKRLIPDIDSEVIMRKPL